MAKTILLTDDDAQILETAKDILEAADYQVFTAETGALALEALQNHSCDAMIVDFNLLDMTGLNVALKAKQLCPSLPIILMTGEAGVTLGDAKDAIHSVLTKPVNPSDLLALLQKILA